MQAVRRLIFPSVSTSSRSLQRLPHCGSMYPKHKINCNQVLFRQEYRFYCQAANTDDLLHVRLSVLGVGGAGCNAVNTMILKKDLTELEFFVANTDAQSLQTSECEKENRIQIGRNLTKCLGAGANPQVGKEAAMEDLESIVKKIGDTNMCFIAAGMGGGTGTGGAPVVAKALRDQGILTIGMVCMPFRFEGKRKMNVAMEGIKEMQASVDTLIVVQNERLLKTVNQQQDRAKRIPLTESFKMVDNIFYEGIKAVTDVIVKPGLINLDFADVRTITEGPGWGIMGSGYAEGHGKAEVATKAALDNPLLSDTSKRNATGVLVSITGGSDLAILEVDEILRLIREEVSEDANVIFGATTDENMKGAISVSLILTGPYGEIEEIPLVKEPERVKQNSSQVPPIQKPPVYPPPHFSQAAPADNPRQAPRPSQVFQVAPAADDLTSYPPENETNMRRNNPREQAMLEREYEQQAYHQSEAKVVQQQHYQHEKQFSSAEELSTYRQREPDVEPIPRRAPTNPSNEYHYPHQQQQPQSPPQPPPNLNTDKPKDRTSWWSTKWY